MIDPTDLAHCKAAIRTGSHSFYAASKLLPSRVRDPALALYAFCRLADDSVDLNREKTAAVLRLRDRLDLVYAGRPYDAPADRAFAAMVEDFDMPQTLPDALLEGLAWDAAERQYDTLSGVRAYSARVAAAVGAMMTVLMGVRDRHALARACDLGVAMQLTNIARDVGEDAREGRLYLPRDWFAEGDLTPEAFLAEPAPYSEVRHMTRRLLAEAQRLYIRSEAGISALPKGCRPGIFAARHIYAGIGGHVRRRDFDNINHRARTGTSEKVALAMLALGKTATSFIMPQDARLMAKPLDEVAFLVDAAAQEGNATRTSALISILAQLEMMDREARGV